ncbi:choice-of-anchor L domain-containing protein [Aequorivita sp. SDUM287046]|uniref:Choice-of-anchor L domain-containing protein n=1 Tax=Aequorivita aurantiaca TaxID=3053356 RepID=A0ABT8DH13_9FLAO|nr:choice-of-anchor L domain-containing protein [Aequorivita aurantiaca]MDN3724695.1 choice-of-anchor L domain-containing protein [Aequorivita aurantiaca]
MKFFVFALLAILSVSVAIAQNIQIDATTYTPQQLVEDILIDSGCISNVQITSSTSGNFPDGDKSFGYYTANGSTFPFQRGVVMSTGKLKNVPGPNTSLSDDDAPGWNGDQDLETALNISNTTNATILEFDFVPNADNIQFRYLFASEEYQEGDPNTCIYSDAFAFLIKPIGGTYTNIAVVPGTTTPVLVTTVHSGIPGSCPPINETYFEGWNGPNAPINFNGQTKILVAETPVTVNQPYHIKLVIADEKNYRYDSAVFLEGGSFNIAANLGPDRSFRTNNPLCDGETYILDATPQGTTPLGYTWYRDGTILPGETAAQLAVTTPGMYSVAIDYGNTCIATDEVLIEYSNSVNPQNTELYQCEPTASGIAVFNLFDAEATVINGDPLLRVYSFHKSFIHAENNTEPIPNPENYTNSQPDERVYARIVSEYGCVGVAEITLKTTTNTVSDFFLVECAAAGTPSFASFSFSETTAALQILFGNNSEVTYHLSYEDAIEHTNPLPQPFTNTQPTTQTVYARIGGDRGCLATAKVHLNVIDTPAFEGAEILLYCLNTYPETITIDSGLIGTTTNTEFLWSTGETTPSITINEPGNYTVTVTRSETINNETFACTGVRTFTVVPSETAQITYQLSGNVGNATLTVQAEGAGSYLYALDYGPFQQSPIFENVSPGEHTIVVKDANGCGTTTLLAFVVGFPSFFTPNNDGYHDYWQVAGQDRNNGLVERVEIFNRFGKILYALNLNGSGWDGTYNGRQLPSSDYWFKATFKNGLVYRGHFTLKR